MSNLMMLFVVLLLFPFLLGYIHLSINKRVAPLLIQYRYFMTLNMLLAGVFVAARMFFNGPAAAQISNWAYSPMFNHYGAAVLSIVLMGVFTLYSRRVIALASGLCWLFFLSLSTVLYMCELSHRVVADVGPIILHIVYNSLVSIVMLGFLLALRKYFSTQSK